MRYITVEKGVELYLLNRGKRNELVPKLTKLIPGDIRKRLNPVLNSRDFKYKGENSHVERKSRICWGFKIILEMERVFLMPKAAVLFLHCHGSCFPECCDSSQNGEQDTNS